MGSASINDIHEWGQYHNSRLALHVLARLAFPEEPDALLAVRHRERRLEKAPLNLEALCALAASIGLKARTREERDRALALFDLAYRRLGGAMPAEHQALHVTTAYLNGRKRLFRQLMKAYSAIPESVADSFGCQDAHPRHGGSVKAYMRRFKQFTGWPELESPGARAPLCFDSLRTAPLEPIVRGPKISVVMTCFRPDEALLTAVRSIVAQTWQNWELLVVDDGSGPEYEDVLLAAAALDPRVKLLIQPENAGTYQARNRAMAVAQGTYITGLDSDDWAHPTRLAAQVRPMLTNSNLVMVETRCIALAEDLSLMIDPQVALIAARSTPIMIRAKEVLGKVGFYDEVRKTADSEYRFRIRTAFGKGAFVRLSGGPLTAVRHNDSTLSAGEVSRHWMSAARFAYYSGFARWHRAIDREQASPFLASIARPRPFPITRDLTRSNAENRAIEYGRIYAADWSDLGERRRSMLDDAGKRADEGMAVGLLHAPDWNGEIGDRALVDRAVLRAAAEHGLDFIEPEERHTAPVIVPTEAYGELLRFEHPEIEADRIRLLPGCAESGDRASSERAGDADGRDAAAAAARGAGDRSDSAAAGRPAKRAVFRRNDILVIGGGLAAVAVASLLTAAVEPESLPWVAGASLAVWAGSFLSLAVWRTAVHPAPRRSTIAEMTEGPAKDPISPRSIARAAARRPVWSVATVAPFSPALGAVAPQPWLPVGIALIVLGALAACIHLGLTRAFERARAEAAEPATTPATGVALNAQKRLMLERWEARLNHGWSISAGEALEGIAAGNGKGFRETQIQALAALCAHRAARARDQRPARTLHVDIVIVSTLNLKGGTTSANEAEILAYRAAGLTVALVHHPVKERAMGRPVDPKIRALIDDEQVFQVHAGDTVHCDLAIMRFPVAFEHLMEDRPRIEAARTVLLVNQTPFEEYGPVGGYGTAWSIRDVHRNLTEWVGHHTWYAIGPAVRDVLHAHHAEEMEGIDLATDFWYETIDIAEWTPRERRVRAEGEPIRLGRHSRDHVTKFPNMARQLLTAYPDVEGIEVHMLGGHEALHRILGKIPSRWTSHQFGTKSAVDFLGQVDVYAYYIDENLLEAFGRAPMEAMAAGVPCILPPNFAELFGDGAIYCEPGEVEAQVRLLASDQALYAERAAAGLRVVHERFSPDALLRRVNGLGVSAGEPNRTIVPMSLGGAR